MARLFVAISLDPSVREQLFTLTQPLRDALPWIRWTREEQLHITVRFIGEETSERIPQFTSAIAAAVRDTPILPLELREVGAFPTFKRARVVWFGAAYDPKLELLHNDVETACMSLGLEAEGRPFRPHVTLGRIAERITVDQARDLVRAGRGIRERVHTEVRSIDLMQSELSSSGARHVRLAAAPLKEA